MALISWLNLTITFFSLLFELTTVMQLNSKYTFQGAIVEANNNLMLK